jgi:hypothetical protein
LKVIESNWRVAEKGNRWLPHIFTVSKVCVCFFTVTMGQEKNFTNDKMVKKCYDNQIPFWQRKKTFFQSKDDK